MGDPWEFYTHLVRADYEVIWSSILFVMLWEESEHLQAYSLYKEEHIDSTTSEKLGVYTNLLHLSRRSGKFSHGESRMWDPGGDEFESFIGVGILEVANLSWWARIYEMVIMKLMLKPGLWKLAPIRKLEIDFSLLGGVYLYLWGYTCVLWGNRTYLYFGWGILVFCKAYFCLQMGILYLVGYTFVWKGYTCILWGHMFLWKGLYL